MARINQQNIDSIAEKGSWETSTPQLIDLMRFVVGSSDEVAKLIGAASRETIYAWKAETSRPSIEQERKLNTIAALVTLVNQGCSVSPSETGTFLRSFNYRQSGVDSKNRLERLVGGEDEHIFEETVQ